jgi:hypothetical protein
VTIHALTFAADGDAEALDDDELLQAANESVAAVATATALKNFLTFPPDVSGFCG